MMCLGIKKKTMQVFEGGNLIQVTVIEIPENRVVQIKSLKQEGYSAVQMSIDTKQRCKKLTKAVMGHYKKWNVNSGNILVEFKNEDIPPYKEGIASLDIFEKGKYVDVFSKSKGKGYAGVVKRWNFSTQDATHGNSLSHRAPGSIGQRQFPGRVFKGKKMSGRLGGENCVVCSLRIVDRIGSTLVVSGSIPGPKNAVVQVKLLNRM